MMKNTRNIKTKKKYRINKAKMIRRLLLIALLIFAAVKVIGFAGDMMAKGVGSGENGKSSGSVFEKLIELVPERFAELIPEKLSALFPNMGKDGEDDNKKPELTPEELAALQVPEYVDVQLIETGKARSGRKLDTVRDIVVHYVGNPGTSGQNNHDYFANPGTNVCSHFVIGLEGEIIQCVPLDERSAASNNRNKDTVSIECCHPDEGGKFTDATYDSLIKLLTWLCDSMGLSSENVIRHHDVTGKICPKYYVEHEDAWLQLKEDVKKALR